MSSQCISSIRDSDVLSHDTVLRFEVDWSTCKTFRFDIPDFTVIDFSFNLRAPAVFEASVSFYRLQDTQWVEIASSLLTDLFFVLSKEFSRGEYVVCFETSSRQTIGFEGVARFRGYQRQVLFNPGFASGEAMSVDLSFPRRESVCTRPLFFKILEGSLPRGMWMTSLGRVQGIVPELDCLEDNEALSPSQNWSYTNFDGAEQSWGRQWRFRVEVSIQGMPDVRAEEWFCVSIHNNWDKDRDAFLAQAPFVVSHDVISQPEPIRIPNLCPETTHNTPWKPAVIPVLCTEKIEVARPPEIHITRCESCAPREVQRRYPLPFGVPDPSNRNFKAWLESLDTLRSNSLEINEFVERLLSDPVIAAYTCNEDATVEVQPREIVVGELSSEDPQVKFWEWRAAQNQRLPWGGVFQDGVSLEAEFQKDRSDSSRIA